MSRDELTLGFDDGRNDQADQEAPQAGQDANNDQEASQDANAGQADQEAPADDKKTPAVDVLDAGPGDDSSAVDLIKSDDPNFRPFCPVHLCVMRVTSTKKTARYYSCKVKDCAETYQEPRKQKTPRAMPTEPHICGRCNSEYWKKGKKKKRVAMIVGPRQPDGTRVRLVCPTRDCSFTMDIMKPDCFAEPNRRRPNQPADYLDV